MPRRSSRSTETRLASQRPDPESQFQSSLYFPRHRWPKGMTCRWIRVGVQERPDQENWASAHRRGWKPLPPELAPEYVIPNPDGSLPTAGIVRLANHILCQKPTADVKRDRDMVAERTQEQSESLNDYVRENSDVNIQRFNHSSPTQAVLANTGEMFKD